MKTLLIFLTFFCAFSLHAGDFISGQEFGKLSNQKKVEVIKAYKEFVRDYSKNENGFDSEELTTHFKFLLINEAFAAQTFNCFYAGWPSVKKNVTKDGKSRTVCSSPMKSNPEYKALAQACGAGQMLCQPALFGAKMCIEVRTQEQKNSAFSQCQQKFTQSGKTLQDLANEISKGEMAALADEMFILVNDICGSGFQSKTGMCVNLKKKMAAIKAVSVSSPVKVSEVKPEIKPEIKLAPKKEVKNEVVVINEGKVSKDEVLKEKLVKVIEKVAATTAPTVSNELVQETVCVKCEQMKQDQKDLEVLAAYEASEAIDQSKPTPDDFCSRGAAGSDIAKIRMAIPYENDQGMSIDIDYKTSKDDAKGIPDNFDLTDVRMGKGKAYVDEGKEYSEEEEPLVYPKRTYSFAFANRGKENSFEIVDRPVRENYVAGKVRDRFVSNDMRITELSFFPRKVVPSVKLRGDKIIMKMTTGEEIIADSATGRIIGGAGKQVPAKKMVETFGNQSQKNIRTYPDGDFSYQGEAIFLETHGGEDKKPGHVVSAKAFVGGKYQECKLKSDDLWERKFGSYLPQDHDKYLSSSWSCYKFKFQQDEDLYRLIKQTCPSFVFPPLAK